MLNLHLLRILHRLMAFRMLCHASFKTYLADRDKASLRILGHFLPF
jgi:hypothetical protein